MLDANALIFIALAYVVFLFAVAFFAERRARSGGGRWLRSPWIYTLSLSVYCTAWTFYGAVGYAARSGLEFITIYLGPTLVMIGWWVILRRLVRIGRELRITSIADLISSRYGKSINLGVIVTVLAVIGTTPYIALQLQSVTLSFSAFFPDDFARPSSAATALWVASGLAFFTILFGTRNIDTHERHHGVVLAIAVEAVVKLAALVAVGIFVVWGLSGGLGPTLERIGEAPLATWDVSGARWVGLTFLSAAAFLCLPRMFHVLVVENSDERHLATASWAFPLYLLAMSLFVVPIAVVGLERLPQGSNPDLFVLTLPLSEGANSLAVLSFLGGFSSATSMVIVAAIALSTMVSNHIVLPIWMNRGGATGAVVAGDVRQLLIRARRIAIGAILALGWAYYWFSGGGAALAAIGLIAFVGLAQVLPAMLGGIFWRGATRVGAAAGLLIGSALWLYTLFLPSFGPDVIMTQSLLENGPFGLTLLRPQALFGLDGMDHVIHALLWSMLFNTLAFVLGSIFTFPLPIERLQGAEMVHILDRSRNATGWAQSRPPAEDLLVMMQRIIGSTEAQRLFREEAGRQGAGGYLPDITPDFLSRLERELAGSVGAATAHAMLGQITGGSAVTVEELIAVADETAQIMEYSSRLESQSRELTRTARQLRDANRKLTELSVQKDAFLSQISHELRTPMTSILSFSGLLKERELEDPDRLKFAGIISEEAERLTRLLDDLLDLSVLENGQFTLQSATSPLGALLDRAIMASQQAGSTLKITRQAAEEGVIVSTDLDRLTQVFINIIANAHKYCDAEAPELRIIVRQVGSNQMVDFIDNGSGIPIEKQQVIFEKFARAIDQTAAGGAGLGLAICREIMERLGGGISYLPGQGGGAFRVVLPKAQAIAAA